MASFHRPFLESSIIRPKKPLRPMSTDSGVRDSLFSTLFGPLSLRQSLPCGMPFWGWVALFLYQGFLPIPHLLLLLGGCVLLSMVCAPWILPSLANTPLFAYFAPVYPLNEVFSLLRIPISSLLHWHWSRVLLLATFFLWPPLQLPKSSSHARGFPLIGLPGLSL